MKKKKSKGVSLSNDQRLFNRAIIFHIWNQTVPAAAFQSKGQANIKKNNLQDFKSIASDLSDTNIFRVSAGISKRNY